MKKILILVISLITSTAHIYGKPYISSFYRLGSSEHFEVHEGTTPSDYIIQRWKKIHVIQKNSVRTTSETLEQSISVPKKYLNDYGIESALLLIDSAKEQEYDGLTMYVDASTLKEFLFNRQVTTRWYWKYNPNSQKIYSREENFYRSTGFNVFTVAALIGLIFSAISGIKRRRENSFWPLLMIVGLACSTVGTMMTFAVAGKNFNLSMFMTVLVGTLSLLFALYRNPSKVPKVKSPTP